MQEASGVDGERQRGVNRVVIAVWDLDTAKTVYEKVLGATFLDADPADTVPFGVSVSMAFDAGVELVAPLPDTDSWVRRRLAADGEGVVGVVFAVPDADAALTAAEEEGASAFYSLDYGPEEIAAKLAGSFRVYREHFLATGSPFGRGVILGEFVPTVPIPARDEA